MPTRAKPRHFSLRGHFDELYIARAISSYWPIYHSIAEYRLAAPTSERRHSALMAKRRYEMMLYDAYRQKAMILAISRGDEG